MKTYRGRTEAEQREFNNRKKENYARKQELKKQGIEIEDTEDDILEVDTESIQPPSVPTLKDKLMAHFKNDVKPEEGKPKAVDKQRIAKSENLLANTLPLMLSGLLALNAQKIFKEPYKICAPTKEEVSTILFPIFAVVSRHVEIEGKASQDALDIGAAFVAAITVGTRVAITKMEVDNYVKEQSRSAEQSNVTQFRGNTPGTLRGSQAANNGAIQHPISQDGTGTNGGGEYVRHGNGDNPNGSSANGPSEADRVHDLMRRDREGRARLGLAPFTV